MNEESIFAVALEKQSAAERQTYLEEACGGNAELRAQVDELLRASDDAGSFLNHAPVSSGGTDATIAATRASGDTEKSAAWTGSLPFLDPCDKPDRIGKLGHYEIIEVVGYGGMGAVLRAFDTKLSRVVAVKIMAPELAANPTAVKRFLREAQSAASVHHDHVVTIHAVEEAHRPPYLVMQFIDGQTLAQKIEREGALKLHQILRIGSQVAAGLGAAHKHGLIHRDVKPANILLENGVERVKITDFGLARAADDLEMTQTGMIAGTPQYMSPEQAKGEAIDMRSDLFSLGSVLYTMCAGRAAFRADNTMAVLRRVCEDVPRPIHEVNPEIPQWLEAIVGKLLAKKPDDRFQTASEVAELLGQHLAHVQSPTLVPRPATVVVPSPVQPAVPFAMPAKMPPASPSGNWAVVAVIVVLGLFMILTPVVIAVFLAFGLAGTAYMFQQRQPQAPMLAAPPLVTPRVAAPAVGSGFSFVDLQPQGNVGIAAGTRHGNHLAELGVGQRTLGGVPFLIGEKYLHLGDGVKYLPAKIEGLAVGQRALMLHFLHATEHTIAVDDPSKARGIRITDGVRLAEYVVKYQDGTEETIPVIHGEDIRDWWNWDNSKPVTRGKEIWQGLNSAIADEQPNRKLRLFLSTWENPHPEKTIVTIDYLRAKGVLADPFCVAITCQQAQSEAASVAGPPLASSPFDAAAAKAHQEAWAAQLGVQPEIENSLGMKLRLIPPGKFTMGSTQQELEDLVERVHSSKDPAFVAKLKGEIGPRKVLVREPFYLGTCEVTVGQFRRFVEAMSYQSDGEKSGDGGWSGRDGQWIRHKDHVWKTPGEWALADDQPVVHVSHQDAQAFCEWLSQEAGRLYTLPTEVQWEFAARAGTTGLFGASGDPQALAELGWAKYGLPTSRPNQPQPVGGKTANSFGLFDMLGNVWEWTDTWHPRVSNRRVFRGGSWYCEADQTRPASIGDAAPNMAWDAGTGFRVAIVGNLMPNVVIPHGSSADILTSSEWEWTEPENLGPVINSAKSDGGPTLSGDGLTLVFHSDREGSQGAADLWLSTRPSPDGAWTTPVNMGKQVNSTEIDADAALSADGLTVIFTSRRPGGVGEADLWTSTRADLSQPWSEAVNLGSPVNSDAIERAPGLSADGLAMVFNSDRQGRYGQDDLWASTRQSTTAPWSSPRNLGSRLNSSAYQGFATLASDGLSLIYNSNRAGGPWSGPLWISTRSLASAEWSEPTRLWNDSLSAWSGCLSSDARTLLFDSRRPGGQGEMDLWMSHRVRKQISK